MDPLMRIQALVFADSGISVKNVLKLYSFFREVDSNLHKINKNIFIQIAILLLYHSHNMAAGGYS